MSISYKIIKWYTQHKRDLPWRNTTNPYNIWLSEVILQQTRVSQGLSYYYKFINRFPEIIQLAEASEDEILKLWQGLGYYSRARNMHFTAKYIVNNLNGKFPERFDALVKLKGIGKYTAAAIASFAFGEVVPVVDGNVIRVLSRLNKIVTSGDLAKNYSLFFPIALKLIDIKKPGIFNQAIMEFGALLCTPANPQCGQCPVRNNCKAFADNCVNQYPVKKKIKTKDRYLNYLIFHYKKSVFVKKREDNDIWQNLYDFPLIETKKVISLDNLFSHNQWHELIEGSNFKYLRKSDLIRYKLSHQTLHVIFYHIEITNILPVRLKKYKKVSVDNLGNLAVPVLIANYILPFTK